MSKAFYNIEKEKTAIQYRIKVLEARQSLNGMRGVITQFLKAYPEFAGNINKAKNMYSGKVGIEDKHLVECFCSFCETIKKS